MSIERAIETLRTARVTQRKHEESLMARIEDLSKQLVASKAETEQAQKRAEQERRDKDEARSKLDEARQMAIDARAKAATQIATLEAEAEVLALRDRDSRNEIDRLRMTKKK